MMEISTLALEAAIEAVDEKIGSLQAQISQHSDAGNHANLKNDLTRFIQAADSLRMSHEEAVWQSYRITPYKKLVHFYENVVASDDEFPHVPGTGNGGESRCQSHQ